MHLKTIIFSFLTLFLCFSLAQATMVCPTCGKTYPDDYVYCDDDGTKLVKKVKPPQTPPPPEEPQTKIVGPGIKLVRIPGGTFQMGSNEGNADEKPVHTVTVDSFWMGEAEVTIGQYVAFLNEVNPSVEQFDQWISFDIRAYIIKNGNKYYAEKGWENYPMVVVSWYGARDFCAQYGLRLPTEAEWEYAAGGPKHFKYPWGNTFDKNKCCCFENQGKGYMGTIVVKSFPRNGYWLYDMAGNVWEWCNDWYGIYNTITQNNPQGAKSGEYKTNRGGSCSRDSFFLRCACRHGMSAHEQAFFGADLGFRVAGD